MELQGDKGRLEGKIPFGVTRAYFSDSLQDGQFRSAVVA